MTESELHNRILNLPTDQLEKMVKEESEQYRPEAILMAKEELLRRNSEAVTVTEDSDESEIKCLRCGQMLTYVGNRKFHEGTRYGFLGDIGELFVNRESLEFWACPKCGHVEFFMEPKHG